MPKFISQLDGVLRQRKLVEERILRELSEVEAERGALDLQLRELDRSVRDTADEVRTSHLTGPLDMNFLAAHRRYSLAMQRKATGLAQQIAAVQRRLQEARRAAGEAAKQRKIVEKLRDRRKAIWTADIERKELTALDEVSQQIAYRAMR